jgi:hypothetical protein
MDFIPLKRLTNNYFQKILFKNQRPPAEVAPANSRGHPHTPNSAGGR